MTIFCILRNDTDGHTYSCETLVGFGLTQEEAITILLRHIEHMAHLKTLYQQFQTDCDAIRHELWSHQKQPAVNDKKAHKAQLAKKSDTPIIIYQTKLKDLDAAYRRDTEGMDMMSADIEDYEIRQMESGHIQLDSRF